MQTKTDFFFTTINLPLRFYDIVTHAKKLSVTSFDDQNIQRKVRVGFMLFKNTTTHFEAELERHESDAYFCSKVKTKLFHVVVAGGARICFLWSSKHGGKNVDTIFTCLERVTSQYNFGASHMTFSTDGALVSIDLICVFFLWCHPNNPKRRAKSIKHAVYEGGS